MRFSRTVVCMVVGLSGCILLYALQIFLISILDEMGHVSGTSGYPASALLIVLYICRG